VKMSSRGRLPRLLQSSRGQLDGVTMVGGSPAQRRPAVAILGGPPAKAKGQNGTLAPYRCSPTRRGSSSVTPRSDIAGTKPPHMCPGCFIHTYSNNMINIFHV
jgi:hypothetical protein